MSGFKRIALVLAMLIAVFVAGRAAAQDVPEIVGTWSGAVSLPTGDLRLVLYVTRDEGGALGAQIESIDQNPGTRANVTTITATSGTLDFSVAPIGARYQGTW